jgi:hypothetical protein
MPAQMSPHLDVIHKVERLVYLPRKHRTEYSPLREEMNTVTCCIGSDVILAGYTVDERQISDEIDQGLQVQAIANKHMSGVNRRRKMERKEKERTI